MWDNYPTLPFSVYTYPRHPSSASMIAGRKQIGPKCAIQNGLTYRISLRLCSLPEMNWALRSNSYLHTWGSSFRISRTSDASQPPAFEHPTVRSKFEYKGVNSRAIGEILAGWLRPETNLPRFNTEFQPRIICPWYADINLHLETWHRISWEMSRDCKYNWLASCFFFTRF